jgi:hypothetical protein
MTTEGSQPPKADCHRASPRGHDTQKTPLPPTYVHPVDVG